LAYFRYVTPTILLSVALGTLCASAFGQFETRSSAIVGESYPIAAAVGDFNRDGKLDLAVVEFLPTGTLSILLGNGDGTFRPGASYAVATQPQFLTTADFRHNGILDLVVTDTLSDNVYVLLGNGDGTFQSPVSYPTNGYSSSVSTGDFTGDGKLDIIAFTGSVQCICISVFPGNGDGTFQSAVTTPVPYNTDAQALAVGNFNADRDLDVAVAGEFGGENHVDIMLGNGDGTFRPDGYYEVLSSPQSIAVGDFNGDKKLDLAVGNYEGNSIGVLLGNGDGTFSQAVNYGTSSPTWVVAEDFDGDGKLDLAVANFILPAGVSVLRGNGDGTFQAGVFYPAGSEISYVVAGDFNRDRRPDLLAVNYGSNSVIALLNTGVVTFSPTTPLTFKKQAAGTTSAPQTVKLTNTGATELKISSMKAAGQFGMTSTCGTSVAAGANCTISLTFSPKSKGAKSGTVTINDSASSKPQVIELSGTGT